MTLFGMDPEVGRAREMVRRYGRLDDHALALVAVDLDLMHRTLTREMRLLHVARVDPLLDRGDALDRERIAGVHDTML